MDFANIILRDIDKKKSPNCRVTVYALNTIGGTNRGRVDDRFLIVDENVFIIEQLQDPMDKNLFVQGNETMEYRDKYKAAHFMSPFPMRQLFRLIEEIAKHDRGEDGEWQRHSKAIEEIAVKVSTRELNCYNLHNDEYVKTHYGVENYAESNLVCEMAFYLAGLKRSKLNFIPSLDFFDEIHGYMDGGFYLGYQPSKEALCQLVESLRGRSLEIASKSRDIYLREGALERQCVELEKISDEDELIKQINQYNDGSHMELWGAVSCLAGYLISYEMWHEVYLLADIIRYFPLQGRLIRMVRSVRDIVALTEQFELDGGRKSLLFLLRDQWFRVFAEERELLENNYDEDGVSDENKAYIHGIIEEFDAKKKERIEKGVSVWLKVFGKEEVSVWLADKTAQAERKHEKYGKPELDILELVKDAVQLSNDDVKSFDLKDKDFASLLTFAREASEENVADAVIEAIANTVFGEKFYTDTTLNEKWFENARTIYRCMSVSSYNGQELLEEHRKPMEGYNVDLGVALRNEKQEAYWLAILLLSLEENSDTDLFHAYVDILFKDTRFGVNSLTDDVFTPYYVAEMLVSQVMTSEKDSFESRLINEVPYLVFVFRVLSANEGTMSEEVRKQLSERVANDWETERKLLSQYKSVNHRFYDEFVEKVNN